MSLLIRGADLGQGQPVDVRIVGGVIDGVTPTVPTATAGADQVVEAGGGALLPGLHDHHIHLHALAAARRSVFVGTPTVRGFDDLAAALRSPDGTGWVRAVGYHESVAGPLDRWRLDELVPARPVRIQHRSGALWIVNSVAVDRLGLASSPELGIERDSDGVPTGRLWRLDRWLRSRVGHEPVDLGAVATELASYGITGVTDATPDLDPAAVAAVQHLPLDVLPLGDPHGTGPRKILLSDHDLPPFPDLVALVQEARRAGRAVAVHCVTRASMVLTLAVLDEVGARPGDRIEHGAVLPPELIELVREHGLRVVTQPGFLVERAAQYRAEVEAHDRPHLYPYAALLAAGVLTAPSSDAPFGVLDPWRIIAAARSQGVEASTTLAGFLSRLDDPGGPPRQVAAGAPADLCLLDAPLARALERPSRDLVRLTLQAGRPVHGAM